MIGTQPRATAAASRTSAAPLIIRYAQEARPNDPTFPLVALAIASGEGGLTLPAPAGDNGTSFGPFQLHEGGALPAGKGEAWANSPAGIKYGVDHIASVLPANSRGNQSIALGVTRFERPLAPGPEIQRDVAYYRNAQAQGGIPGFVPSGNLPNPGGALGTGSGTAPTKITPGLFDCSGSDSFFFGLVSTPSTGAIGCYLLGALKLVGMAALAGGFALAGFYLILPRGQARALRNAIPLPTPGGGGRSGGAGQATAGASSPARDAAEARREELHGERVKQARARTSKTRADARTARHKALQAKQGTGTSYRLSANAEAQLRRAQKSSAGRGRPDRMAG